MKRLLFLFSLLVWSYHANGQALCPTSNPIPLERVRNDSGVVTAAICSDTNGNILIPTTQTINTGIINFYDHNNVLWVGSSGTPYKYTTFESAFAGSECPTNGCEVNLISGFGETFTSPIVMGNATTLFNHLEGYPGSGLTCNITNGSTCILMKTRSTITGQSLGNISNSSGIGGFQLKLPATANVATLLGTDDTNTPGNAYIRAENIFAQVDPAATVSKAVFDFPGVQTMSSFHNLYAYNFANTIGVNFRSFAGGNAVLGPINVDNIWSVGNGNAGARPCVLQAVGGASVFGVSWVGGVCNDAGNGLANMEFNGNGNATQAFKGAAVLGTYFENNFAVTNTAIKLQDVNAVHISNTPMLMQDTDTGIDISQSLAHATRGIQVTSVYASSPTGGVTLLNNHITGHVIGPNVNILPFYNYGADVGTTIGEFTVESNNVGVYDASNHRVFSLPAQTSSGVAPTFFNGANASMTAILNSGVSSGQQSCWQYQDRATAEWQVCKLSNNGFQITDQLNGKAFINLTQQATRATTGQMNFTSAETIAFRNNANSADILFGKNASDQMTFGGTQVSLTVGSGTAVMTTAAVTAGTCGATVTVASANVLATDSISWSFNAAPNGTQAGLSAWPTAGNVNFAYCGIAETPAAATINWRVTR